MFLSNPLAARQNLAELIREEERELIAALFTPFTSGYSKRVNTTNRVRIVDGIPYQRAGGGRRRLSTHADY